MNSEMVKSNLGVQNVFHTYILNTYVFVFYGSLSQGVIFSSIVSLQKPLYKKISFELISAWNNFLFILKMGVSENNGMWVSPWILCCLSKVMKPNYFNSRLTFYLIDDNYFYTYSLVSFRSSRNISTYKFFCLSLCLILLAYQ